MILILFIYSQYCPGFQRLRFNSCHDSSGFSTVHKSCLSVFPMNFIANLTSLKVSLCNFPSLLEATWLKKNFSSANGCFKALFISHIGCIVLEQCAFQIAWFKSFLPLESSTTSKFCLILNSRKLYLRLLKISQCPSPSTSLLGSAAESSASSSSG